MRVGSLFSGIGGIELGFERAGLGHAIWFVENDPHAQAVLRKHWPNAQVYDDVTTVDFSNVPRVDILTGGFPCQDISNAGKRAGITGSRSGLWKHYLRAISALRPRIVFAENVAALTRRGLDTVLADLAAIGYDAEWHCVPAAAVGAPHRRDRIAILAYPNGCGCVYGQAGEFAGQGGEHAQCDVGEGCQDVAHTDEERLSESQEERKLEGGRSRESSERSGGQWSVEPDVGRVAYGVPARVDRIKRLGNAVVPQWAEAIGRAIKEVEGW